MVSLPNRSKSMGTYLKKKNLQRSWIEMKPEKVLKFASNGYVYNSLDFAIYGYWSHKMVVEMLPVDYEPRDR